MDNVSLIIVALITAFPATLAWFEARRARLEATSAVQAVAVVHEAVNSKMDKLLAVTKSASHAEGVIEGAAIEKAKGEP